MGVEGLLINFSASVQPLAQTHAQFTCLLPNFPSDYPTVHKNSHPICYLLTLLPSNFPSNEPSTKTYVINSSSPGPLCFSFFWYYWFCLIRLQRFFFSNNSQKYLPYTGSFMCDGKRKVCTGWNVGWISLFKDKFRPVLQKLERKRRLLKLSDFLYHSIFVKLFSKVSQQLLLKMWQWFFD